MAYHGLEKQCFRPAPGQVISLPRLCGLAWRNRPTELPTIRWTPGALPMLSGKTTFRWCHMVPKKSGHVKSLLWGNMGKRIFMIFYQP
jgi:hypothetical protein